jgi:hypothetical protein
MKAFWLGAACVVVFAVAAYGQLTGGQPLKAHEHHKMIAVDDAIVDVDEILFVDETTKEIRIVFKGTPSQGNGGFSVLFIRRTAENWRTLAAATGVAVPPRATSTP